jgi:hypothetical protein
MPEYENEFDELMNTPEDTNEYGEPIENPENGTEGHEDDDDYVDVEAVGIDEEIEEEEEVEEAETEEENSDLSETAEEETTTQTPEENAFYAEQRRQQQEAQRKAELDQQLQERMQQAPEYQVAQLLASQYGMPVDQMLQQLQDSQLEQQAQQQGVPVEFLRQQQETQRQMETLQSQLKQMEFENWMAKQEAEAVQIKQDYPFLTEAEINEARHFMLNDLKTTAMPLSQAVFAKHQAKITSHLKEQAKQEALAEISGRKSNGTAPNVSQSSPESQLSLEERAMAKALGISEKDYLKYK